MDIELIDKNITILAESFNPSIFSEYWLKHEAIIKDADVVLPGSAYNQGFSHILTNDFSLTVTPKQLQYSYRSENGIAVIKSIIEKLPHIPYISAGINYTYFTPYIENNEDRGKKLFANSTTNIFKEFSIDNPRFGAYFSKNYLSSRLKLNVLPVKAIRNDGAEVECLQYSFNFHHDISQRSGSSDLLGKIDQHTLYESYANKIVASDA